jgi:hypothetical protein
MIVTTPNYTPDEGAGCGSPMNLSSFMMQESRVDCLLLSYPSTRMSCQEHFTLPWSFARVQGCYL